jgi:AcrR family transcriptional regulator
MTATEEDRRIGRPRSAAADEAIIEAAVDEFVEYGYRGISFEGVAARAGVGKTTVYRRYASRLELVMAACDRICEQKGPTPDTGALRTDLLELARGYRRMMTSTTAGKAIPAMMASKVHEPELAEAHEAWLRERRVAAREMIQRAIERGELPKDADAEVCLDQITGPIFYRIFVTNDPIGDKYIERLVDRAMRGEATPAGDR